MLGAQGADDPRLGQRSDDRPGQIITWWTATPHALIGMPTGLRTGIAALDIDRKGGVDGLRALAGRDYVDLPQTPTVLTARGGFHLHFQRPAGGFRNTVGKAGRGIGDGLDWRCDGGLVILPSPGTGYRWDDTCNYDTCARLAGARRPTAAGSRDQRLHKHNGRLATIGPTVSGLAGVERCLRAASKGERNSAAVLGSAPFRRGHRRQA